MRKSGWQWYLKRNGEEYGPLTHSELLLIAGLGRLRSGDRLWTPGFPRWVPAGLIPGLLKPSFTYSTSAFGRSWEEALRGCAAALMRIQQRVANFLRGVPIRLVVKLPLVWLGAASLGVIIIIGASTQDSESSFAISAPPTSLVETTRCDSAEQVQPQETQTVALPSSQVIADAHASDSYEVAEANEPPRAIESDATEDVSSPLDHELVGANEHLTAVEDSVSDDAVPLPTRKPSAERPLRRIETKDGARSVQRRLRDLGYLAANADGSWGSRSRIALKQFQLRAKIPPVKGWDRRAERVLFSTNAPRAPLAASSPFLQAQF